VQDPGALGQGARDLDRIANHLRCRGGAARNTGGSIGVSLVASVFTYRQQFHQNRLIEQMIPSSTQYQDTLQQITNFFTDHGSSLSQAHDQAIESRSAIEHHAHRHMDASSKPSMSRRSNRPFCSGVRQVKRR
jgi:hypothetical protein